MKQKFFYITTVGIASTPSSYSRAYSVIFFFTSKVSYGLVIGLIKNPSTGKCGGPEGLEEAVEFSMRTNISGVYGPWIPLRLTWRCPDSEPNCASSGEERIRGYNVETHRVSSSSVVEQVSICGEDLLPADASEVQFRWMNTGSEKGNFDMWAIFNVTADLTTSRYENITRILDSENSE